LGEVQRPVAVVAWNVTKKEEVIAVGKKNWQVEWVSARNQRMGMKMKMKMKMKIKMKMKKMTLSANHWERNVPLVDPHPAAVVAWNVIEKEEVIVVGIKKWLVEWVSVRNQRMGMKMKKMKKMKLSANHWERSALLGEVQSSVAVLASYVTEKEEVVVALVGLTRADTEGQEVTGWREVWESVSPLLPTQQQLPVPACHLLMPVDPTRPLAWQSFIIC